jgi:hypothetical protein
MTRRGLAWVAAVLACACAGGVGAACTGGAAAPAGAADAAGDDGGALDATGPPGDAAPADAATEQALHGNCEPVKGPCDLVLQDCPAGTQCTTQSRAGGGYATACTATHAVQHIDRGYPCCRPSSPVDDPCLPGLTCIGDPCTGDAGGGRCAPYCCSKDDTPCGASPEGFAGHCDEGVVDPAGKLLYDVCEYAPPCKPLRLLPCPSGYACLVQDTSGGAKCSQIFNGGGPAATEGQPCQYNNSCQDGLMCFTAAGADGGQASTCMMLCYTGQGTPPFDAGALAMGPGTGGCTGTKQCATATQIFPPWLGVCVP